MNTPKQIAASTSVGQCTPKTSRDSPIRQIQIAASSSVTLRKRGQMRPALSASAVANAAVLSVCPLGKLDPQYQSLLQSSGRERCTKPLSV